MSKAKMKFPPVPGDTPREQFMNLARHLITLPKTEVIDLSRPLKPPQRKRAKHRRSAKTA
jgi:hypothetical protein